MTTASTTGAATRQQPPLLSRVNTSTLLMVGVTILLIVVFTIWNPAFLSFANTANLATQIAPVLIIGVAMTFVITSGQIDLSVGAIAAFVAASCAQLVQAGIESSIVALIGAIMGFAWGLVNGALSSFGRIPSFIVTLATMSIIRGLALLNTGGFSVPIPDGTFLRSLGNHELFGISIMAWIALVVLLIGLVLMNKFPFGQYITGIGASEESVRRAGVNTRSIKVWALALSGLAAGIAGVLIAARLGSGSANSAVGLELTVIAAVVIGGTDLFGGRGTVFGTFVGAVLTGVIANGLTLVRMSPFLTPIITGIVLLIAIWLDHRGSILTSILARRRH